MQNEWQLFVITDNKNVIGSL